MRVKFFVSLLCVMLFSFGMAWAQQGDITLDHVDGLYHPDLSPGTDTINTGETVTFHLRINNNTGGFITGSTNAFQVYSPTGAEWDTTAGAWTDAVTNAMYDLPPFVNPFSDDGMGADTLGFGGFKMMAPGIPDGFDEIVWTIDIGPIDATYHKGQICIDSCFYRPIGFWKWSTTVGDRYPTWDGPHCFVVWDSTNVGGNEPPVLGEIGTQSTSEMVALAFGVSATDPEAGPITLTMTDTDLPPAAVFSDNGNGTGDFNWTPTFDDAGIYTATFVATDNEGDADSELVSIEVINVNRPPVLATIGNQTIGEGVNLTFPVSAVDADGDALTLTMTTAGLPPEMAFTDNGDGTGTFNWTPADGEDGVYTAEFTADDGTDQDSETITITVTAANELPVLAPIGNQAGTEDAMVTFPVSATDADGTTPALSMQSTELPPAAAFTDNGDGTGTFNWMTTFDDAGDYQATFYATDNGVEPPVAVSETITISIANVNRIPVLTEIGPQATDENVNLTFPVSATDPDGLSLTLVMTDTDLPAEASFTDNGNGSGTFDWTPTYDNAGVYTAWFIVSDGEAADSEMVTITVDDMNRPPVLAAIGDQAVPEGNLLSFGIAAVDADGNTITLTMTSADLPVEAEFTDNGDGTGAFSWQTTAVDGGIYTATFRAEDEFGAFHEETITITVSDINFPPEIVEIQDFYITECDIIDEVFSASNIDEDPLTLWLEPLADNMTFTDNSDGTGAFHFAPSYAQAGTYPLTLYASDGIATVSEEFVVYVENCQPGSEGDTLMIAQPAKVPGSRVAVEVTYANICQLTGINAIIGWETDYLHLDSISFVGSGAEYLAQKNVTIDNMNQTVVIDLAVTGGEPMISEGGGHLFNMHFAISSETPDDVYAIDPFLIQTVDINPKFYRDCGSGVEEVAPFVVPGGIGIAALEGSMCGTVIDPDWNIIEGATVEMWADFPVGDADQGTQSNSLGGFAFETLTSVLYDLHAYKEGYYPADSADIDFGESGIMIVLQPVEPVYPTNEWVSFYCGFNTFMGQDLPIGSVIDAYDPQGTHCGSWFVTEKGKYGFMPVYGDDPFMDGDQGADSLDVIRFFVNQTYEAIPSVDPIWTKHGDVFEVCLDVSEQTPYFCELTSGWNLVSWPIDTDHDEIDMVLESISGCVDLVLGFEQGGLTYDPTLPEFSTLWEADHLSGYWIKISDNCPIVTLEVTGMKVPVTTQIRVTTGWNLVSYLPEMTLPVEVALASIETDLIVAQGLGSTYLPGQGAFNSLTEMSPCNGYWVKVAQDNILQYPSDQPLAIAAVKGQKTSMANSAESDVVKTTRWVNLYSRNLTVNNVPVASGTEISAHALNGTKVGGFVMGDDGLFGFMPVYANDPASDASTGLAQGDSFYLAVNGEKTDETFTWTTTGDRIEVNSLTSKNEPTDVLPANYSLRQNYPNPFNPTTTIQFDMPKAGKASLQIYNILGALVATPFDGVAAVGQNEVIWDGKDRNGNEAASGVYFYRLIADKYSETRKMTLLK